jgi:outer membrane protein assembly factor BamB
MSKNFATNKLKIQKKQLSAAIAFALMLTIAVTLVALPAANAHTPAWTISTYAYINVAPNPVGVGQTAYVNFWLDKVPPTVEGNWGMHWHNMKVTVTKPNGDTETLGPFDSDAVGGAWTQCVPDQVGIYKFVFNFPGQTVVLENPYPYANESLGLVPLGYDYVNDTYTASTSKEVTLTVQQEQLTTAYPPTPLPTDYWQRPINSMNREWYSIGGNWLGLGGTAFGATGTYDSNGNFNPYTTAPNSAHVVWTKPEAFGGQIGGEFGSSETSLYATGTAYETKFSPVILYGILYYTAYPGAANNPGPLTAVDLRTGKTLWTKQVDAPLRVGMIYKFNTGDQYGAHAYLFTAPTAIPGFIITPAMFAPKWSMYDAMTGDWILDIANASAGTLVEGPNGEILSYTVAGGMLTLWNASKCIEEGSKKNNIYVIYSAAEIWRPPQGATIDWSAGNEWSVPIATNISGVPIVPDLSISVDPSNAGAEGRISDDVILMTACSRGVILGAPGGSQPGYEIQAGYSAIDGHLLWGPINRTLTPNTNVALGAAGDGVYAEYTCQTMTWTGYSIKTGEKLWGPTKPCNSSWGYYDTWSDSVIGYGNLYVWGMSGEVYCYDVKTGAQKWSWNAGNPGVDNPFGTWPLGTWGLHHVLADGKLYVRSGHDYTAPVFKGAKLYCLNATTGEEIWSSLSFDIVSGPACADGIMVWFNGYDNQIYAYGKGQSATTVTASPEVSVHGHSVLMKGTVTDQSPGQTCLGIPAAGTPAIADESMSAWMEYLYQQQPMPTNAKGVEVTLDAVDPNGNFVHLGAVTSDASGMFKKMFTPEVPGEYTIIATFAGSESYYASYAETAIGVSPAPAATPPPEKLVLPPTEMYVIGTGIAIIIAVAIVGLLILRKRP